MCQEATKGSRSPLPRGPEVPTLTSVILEVAFQCKRMRVSIFSDYDMEIVPPLYSIHAPSSLVYLFPGSSSQAPTSSQEEDIFSNLKLNHTSICLPTLSEEGRGIMETILQGRSILRLDGLDVIKTLDKLLTFPSDVE